MAPRPVNLRTAPRRARTSPAAISHTIGNNPIATKAVRGRRSGAEADLKHPPNQSPCPVSRRQDTTRSLCGTTGVIGFYAPPVILRRARMHDRYYSDILAGIQRTTRRHHLRLAVETVKPDALTLPDIVRRNQVDGILVEGDFPLKFRKRLVQLLPVVWIDRAYPELGVSSVMPDYGRAMHERLEYLWARGHRNIVTFQAPSLARLGEIALDRFHTFFSEKQHRVPQPRLCQPQPIAPVTHKIVMKQFAHQIAKAHPRPSAVVASDVYASRLMIELRKLGLRVPEDISIIGLEDPTSVELPDTGLTTYRFAMEQVGRNATELLIQHIQDRKRPSSHVLIGGRITERASCATVASMFPQTRAALLKRKGT